MRRGDFDHAERVYQGILAGNPRDSQALAGLGDVLRMRHDAQGAIDAYKRALSVNPSYVPAMLGLGDTQWAQGDHDGAARTYKSIVDHFPEGTYPAYVNQRATGGGTVPP
jgi:tetratricopeptide (TPR) repeat protein